MLGERGREGGGLGLGLALDMSRNRTAELRLRSRWRCQSWVAARRASCIELMGLYPNCLHGREDGVGREMF